ncbi:hypothetical protein C8T65DRAFT_831089 [Cerioporus squamosus]|nr:hypothetical protein C8T65DRAFT_831089 [Cerioporus squamosus]
MTHRSISDVQDILYKVVPYLNPEHYADQEEIARARKTLLHSALTCRNFTQPALNILWSSLPSEKPLLELLWTLGIILEVETEESASGPFYTYPSQSDPSTHPSWVHFQEYALRVRSITLSPFKTTRELSIWNELVPALRGAPVLPALCTIDLVFQRRQPREGRAPLLPLVNNPRRGVLWLITPTVHHLYLSIPHRVSDSVAILTEREILREACKAAPDLEELRLFLPWSMEFDFLRSHERLRAIEIDRLPNTDALEPLSTLPNLEFLSLSIEVASSIPLTFNRLRELELRGLWPELALFLDQTDLPQLDSLSTNVTLDQYEPAQLIPQCAAYFRTLSSKHAHLTTLRVSCRPITPFHHGPRKPTPTGGPLSAVVEPLLSLHELRDVSLVFEGFLFPYSSSDILSFAESWPSLESFRLEFVTAGELRAGLESLVHFARNCPHLRALHLPEMELTGDALEGIAYPDGQPPHPLRELNVAQVAFPRGTDLSREVMEFTQRVFPHAATPLAEAHPIIVTDEEFGNRSRVI